MFGQDALLIEWPPIIDDQTLSDISALKRKIEGSNLAETVELIPAYNSLTVVRRNQEISIKDLEEAIQVLQNTKTKDQHTKKRIWQIPVCYAEAFAEDLQVFSETKGMLASEVIQLHTEAIYTVHFIGFLPGFLYLGGLDETLHLPRKRTPKLKVPKGAVAIGGSQTGIYPQASPGGWHIIGNSPIAFFDAHEQPPCFAQIGDRVQFYAVNAAEHKTILDQVQNGTYQLEHRDEA